MNPLLEVQTVPKYGKDGKGVFAKKNIKKGDLLSVFGGYIITRKEEESLPEGFQDEGIQISDDLVLGIKDKSGAEDASYFNHSCAPNAGCNGQIFLVAMRNIEEGEEITFDYGMVLCKTKGCKSYKLECVCGAKKCRKYITDNDWKIPELQKKYNGYFQWYIQEKIDNRK